MRDRKGRTPEDIARVAAMGTNREGYLRVLEPYRIAPTVQATDEKKVTADSKKEIVPPSAVTGRRRSDSAASVEPAVVPSVIKYGLDEEAETREKEAELEKEAEAEEAAVVEVVDVDRPAMICGHEILPRTVNLHDRFRLDKWEDEEAVDAVRKSMLPHGVTGSKRQLSIRVTEIGSVENMTLVSLVWALVAWFSIPSRFPSLWYKNSRTLFYTVHEHRSSWRRPTPSSPTTSSS